MQGKALWYVGPGRAELREETVAASKPGEVRVRALFGAISRGTERLVHAGRVPASEYDRMRAPFMGGAFPFPVKYGYATVGRVEAGPAELQGPRCFQPASPPEPVHRSGRRRVSGPRRGAAAARGARRQHGDRAQRGLGRRARPGRSHRRRGRRARRSPGRVSVRAAAGRRGDGGRYRARARRACARARRPLCVAGRVRPTDCDLVFHASGTAAGLATALRLAGEEASIVELSWYGSGEVAAPLGEAFHSRRLRLVSSQVGKVAPSHRVALDSRAATCGGACAARRPGARRAARAGRRRSRTCRRSCLRCSAPIPMPSAS